MHPAPSVIVFTTLSGLGFGLFMWLGLGTPDAYGWSAFAWFFIAYALSVGGLSGLDLPPGERARTRSIRSASGARRGSAAKASWRCSRCFAFAPYAVARIFFDAINPVAGLGRSSHGPDHGVHHLDDLWPAQNDPTLEHARPRRRLFMLYAIAGGTLMSGQAKLAGWLILVLTVLQILAWMAGDLRLTATGTDKGTATGLNRIGKVRMLESAHTARNYVMDEMVHIVGRKHAETSCASSPGC